jgi:hypothetical protein
MMKKTIGWIILLGALGMAGAAHAQEIGRLFTSAQERASLERARYAGKAIAVSVSAEPVAVPVEGEQIMVVNGVVRRSGAGRETIWIDSVPHAGNEQLPGGMALGQGKGASKVALTLRSGRRVNVKAGQHVDAVSGRVREAYQPPKQ